ncbi:splicing regulatory glutamine lysine-rich protein 1 [Blastocystis sp. subtype 4]|uniref:splicing regulatory glutamine lysine-rich protein 1 n=1 Tax=Blastocystis sp. subtype 4 TaxID=944170 RepID=UPI000711E8AB|nr:splicing regulatory glutamine lysine-rich protein 1 [Blastocystis sp. subtype 4]KNB46810.1 splicing regulatory glutamine lysine-rich protein 1 [Blastocystis sp. subtype 4]|eukprot:XP_014530253.1 splicing regulatory glutamine lysine-rich protein 1 [Blastocystis sp. subtype 4]
MADPSAYNQVTKINPQLAGALYQYNVLSNAKPSTEPMLLQQNAFQEQISRTIVEDQIIKVFGTCGVINLAKIATEGMGLKADAGLIVDVSLPLGTRFGFVEFQTRQGADAATKLDGILLGGRPIRVGPSNGPIIQPTAYGPGAATMRNRPPLYKVSAGGFVILDEKAEESINKRIEARMGSVLERLQKKLANKPAESLSSVASDPRESWSDPRGPRSAPRDVRPEQHESRPDQREEYKSSETRPTSRSQRDDRREVSRTDEIQTLVLVLVHIIHIVIIVTEVPVEVTAVLPDIIGTKLRSLDIVFVGSLNITS